MISQDDINRLKLFNEKAKRLMDSRFVKYVFEKGRISFRINAKRGKGVEVSRTLPDQDAIDAFVLTFRYFIQNNERCSFGNLARTYSKPLIPTEMRKKFLDARKWLNDYLDYTASVKLGEQSLTRRRILDVFVYGGLAHTNPQKKETFDKWVKDPFIRGIMEVHFASILISALKVIQSVAELNAKVIEQLEAT